MVKRKTDKPRDGFPAPYNKRRIENELLRTAVECEVRRLAALAGEQGIDVEKCFVSVAWLRRSMTRQR